MPTVHPVLRDLPDYPIVRVARAREALEAQGVRVFDFSTGDPLEPTPEFVRAAVQVDPVCRYPSPAGLPALRAAASGYLQRRFGVELPPAQILATRGSKEAVFHLPFAFIDPAGPKDTVVYPTPGYTVYESGARFAGGVAHGVALRAENGFLLEPWSLPAEVQDRLAVLWINYPHNPSGAEAPAAYLERLAAYAVERDVVLCSDECYVDVSFGAQAPRSLLEFGTKNVLALFSCSKRSGMTGYRTGFVAGDPELIHHFGRLRPNLGVAGPDFVERAAVAAWSDDAHVAERCATFAAKREVMVALLQELGAPHLGGESTFFLWFAAPGGDDEAYAKALLELGIVVIPGSYFGAGGEGYCRIALVPSLADCQAAAQRWRTLV
ncbi:MAG: aminotransferase class I/II-fold pyridoxal phosphate-dependent enzyme [Planctomycetes bacterium]|nr:aminotransferase class I/II-fold pyridoxal phosphate-dependent enzyme [Planctomycetota bacterium]